MARLIKPVAHFTQVSNHILTNSKVSLKAKGLYCYLLSKADNYQFSSDRIANECKEDRKAILSGLNELEDQKYLLRCKNTDGTVDHILFNDPSEYPLQVEEPQSAFGTMDVNTPQSAFGTVAKRDSNNNTDSLNNTNTLSLEKQILDKIEEIKNNPMYSQAKDSNFPLLDEKEIELELKIYLSDYPKSKVTTIFSFLADKNKQKSRNTRNQKQTNPNKVQNETPKITRNYQTLAL